MQSPDTALVRMTRVVSSGRRGHVQVLNQKKTCHNTKCLYCVSYKIVKMLENNSKAKQQITILKKKRKMRDKKNTASNPSDRVLYLQGEMSRYLFFFSFSCRRASLTVSPGLRRYSCSNCATSDPASKPSASSIIDSCSGAVWLPDTVTLAGRASGTQRNAGSSSSSSARYTVREGREKGLVGSLAFDETDDGWKERVEQNGMKLIHKETGINGGVSHIIINI